MKNILIPIDFSENAMNALNYAQAYFCDEPCRFFLLHVIETGDKPARVAASAATSKKDALSQGMSKLRLQTQKSKAAATLADHQFIPIVKEHALIESIRQIVISEHIDLIVTGTRGASGLTQFVLGTKSGDIITKVKCNTLVVPQHATYNPIKTITFPTDFNIDYNHQLLNPLINLIESWKARLHVLFIMKKERRMSNYQETSKKKLELVLPSSINGYNYAVSPQLELGLQEFLKKNPSDLLVMMAKNLNFLQQLLFRPCTDKINYHLTTPFLIIHH